MDFKRYIAYLGCTEGKRVSGIQIKPVVNDITGEFYITDMKLQEGHTASGYVTHTDEALTENEGTIRFHNGVVRGGETIIIPNLGNVSAGLDYYIYPLQDIESGVLALSQGEGAHKVIIMSHVQSGDEVALLASKHQCTKNGEYIEKRGFFQYAAAWDSKHTINIPEGKSARVYVEYQEMFEGGSIQ